MRAIARLSVIPFAAAMAAGAAYGAESEPRWELGFGIGALSIPAYRGSKERNGYILPLPYGTYTGETLAVDREGIRGKLFRSERLSLELSIDAAPPATSTSGARTGMPKLDPVVEAGASIKMRLGARADSGWSLNLPMRAAVATDLAHTHPLGWTFEPHLKYAGDAGGWEFDVAAGPTYAAEAYHDYYYQVSPEFATAVRPAYDARGGYSGSRVTVSASKRFGRLWLGVFARYDDLGHAVFRDSPLVETDHAFLAGGGVAWIFARSKETVPRER